MRNRSPITFWITGPRAGDASQVSDSTVPPPSSSPAPPSGGSGGPARATPASATPTSTTPNQQQPTPGQNSGGPSTTTPQPSSTGSQPADPTAVGPERSVPQRATPTNPNVAQPAQGQTPPQQTAAPPTQPQQAPPPIPAKADALPPDLARAPAGTQIQGQVQSVDHQGRATIRTEQGVVRLELPRGLAAELLRPGGTVTIELRVPSAQPALVRLLLPPPGQTAATDAAVRTGSVEPRPTVPLALGRIITATVVPGSTGQPAATPPPQAPQLPSIPTTTIQAGPPTAAPAPAPAGLTTPLNPGPASTSPVAPAPPQPPVQSAVGIAGRIAQYQAGNERAARGLSPAGSP